MNASRFFDTNVLLYLLSGDQAKANAAETLVASGGIVSVQVLNEFASVATRKLHILIPRGSRDTRDGSSPLHCSFALGRVA